MSVPNRMRQKGELMRKIGPIGKSTGFARAPRDREPVAIAHDYLTQRGGAERVVLSMARAFPGATIYTTLYDPDATFPEFRHLNVRPSLLNSVPALRRNHRLSLPVLPIAVSSMHINADVVIASSSGWAHGFRTPGSKVVYCHSPARWLYQPERYLGDFGSPLAANALRLLRPFLLRWDRRAAKTAERYLANSTVVRDRIHDAYGRHAEVIPPPHAVRPVEDSVPPAGPPEYLEPGFLLCVSRLLPYKNVDAVIEAFQLREQHRLVVVGSGPERNRLVEAAPSNVTFLEGMTDSEMSWLYSNCLGLVAASYEDFGLTPLEAAAHGRPSAALRWGGFLDTIVEGVTAVYFDAPEARLIAAAVDNLAARSWDPAQLRRHAESYDEAAFAAALQNEVARIREWNG